MKKSKPLLCLTIIICLLSFTSQGQIYVAVNGSDINPGTKNKPLGTVAFALRKARELRRLNDPAIKDGIHIILGTGIYRFEEPLFVRPEDSGTKDSPTYIEAAENEQPVFSGGINIKGWKKATQKIQGLPLKAQGKVWVADAPTEGGRSQEFRQLWINNKKAIRVKQTNGDSMNRILSWDHKLESCWIPKPAVGLASAEGLEMFIHQWWAIAILRVRSVEVHGDRARLTFYQPESRIQSEHPWPAPWISKETGNSPFYLMNAIQFLDEPGEWFLDMKNRKLYYYPRHNEDMHAASVTASSLETLVKVEGTIDHPVSYVFFKGISFQHTGWLRPSKEGHVPHQTGMYMLDAYKLKIRGTPEKKGLENQAWIGRPAAAVEVSYTNHTSFEACRFEHLASTGLDYRQGTHNDEVTGNLFKDIGGTGILAGMFSDEASEIHLPYNPKDEREICDSLVISNNLVSNATNEDWSCVGIGAGYVRNTVIEHNEVEDVSYTGISLGWGWTSSPNASKNNRIAYNKIHHYGKHNYDCSGIYTLSAQPNSLITENYIDSIYKAPYAHLPSHWFYLYCDEGSSYFTVSNNWTPSQKYLQNANGPGNIWTNNGPQVDPVVKHHAGLQNNFQYLLKEKSGQVNTQPVNEEHSEVIELVMKEGKQLDIVKLKQLLVQNKMDSNAIYQWKNHYVIFDKVTDLGVMQGKLKNSFPEAEAKVYYDLFYQYSKKKNCTDTTTAKEWQNILLTANLVADPKLQKEYLNYHATQFEKWKEVSQGFCNAGFQQLLIFKNGRQLILVISIPRGESLDKLNPRTTENNPRMDEWNKIMKKYQEGIEGTKKGETWVFLKEINNPGN